MSLDELLARERAAVDAALERLLPPADAWPARLNEAVRYAVFAGGKRVRPVLARLAYAAAGGEPSEVAEAVCGLELIHTYSLVHDDLPALDDDVLRRGRPTVHVAFDEATAVLVGDALLTAGLEVLARNPEGDGWAARRARAVALVAAAAGAAGMVGGQMEDLEATGQVVSAAGGDPEERLERIHRHKTGCLLRASVELGAVLAGVGGDEQARFAAFGERLGLAFQVADDILDATATADELGKSPGKDEAAGKLTYVTLYGLDRARAKLAELETEMVALAAELEGGEGPLGLLAHYVCRRRS
ncbi:MAG: polyprenyl synthetase family protein [Acidobacteria bacterium]|nr:polyprenyl synthetase family protein [Acidobacteriota bacterium]